MTYLFSVLIILFSLNCYSDTCKESVILLEKGKPSPCTGFLFSPEAEKKASKAIDDAKYYKELSDLLHTKNDLMFKENRILEERLALYMNTSFKLAEEVNNRENHDFWKKTFYFGLGIATTSLSVYAASQFTK